MFPWNFLESEADFKQILDLSKSNPERNYAIFKHSTRCIVSTMAKSKLEKSWTKLNSDIPLYLLNIIRFREVSNLIAEELQLKHESPQLIVIQGGELVHHASHASISSKFPVGYK